MSYNSSGIPTDAFRGFRALNTQSYTESNIKLGLQHEGSTLYTAAGSSSNDTIFLTGALPVILKVRSVGYSGIGVSTFIYINPTYTGGTSVPYQNPNSINPVAGLAQILVSPIVTADGMLLAAPTHLLGGTSNQSKGVASAAVGQEKILAPNTAFLLRLTNLDAHEAEITSYLSWYEGPIDLPVG